MSQRPLRLGTRRSLLARAQSSAVARLLERAHPGLEVELVGIETRGDRITDVPLSQVEGKEFFTAEIDAALRAGSVDVTVHSFKDLSLERPAQLHLGAVPERANPRDIVCFASDVPRQLEQGAALRIGSSSPRRQAFVPEFLARALPSHGERKPRVELRELRGNVDTRLRRLREPRGSDRQLDGVVLAFAGLARLWEDESVGAGPILRELLDGLPRMVLPLVACPAAPAQGALAVECRSDDERTRALLAAIDHAPTRADVAVERALLAGRGGGCHQRFGATQRQVDALGTLLYVRAAGEADAGVPELRWHSPPRPSSPVRAWDGSVQGAPRIEELPGVAVDVARRFGGLAAAFITHRHALPEMPAAQVNRVPHIWVPGTGTWFALAARGVWVEGCAESLGFAALRPTLEEALLALPAAADWLALTSREAAPGWGEVPALATYRHQQPAVTEVAESTLPEPSVTHAWWHSGVQFGRWHGRVGANCQHACGPGKTAEAIRGAGVALTVFPSVDHWRKWVRS